MHFILYESRKSKFTQILLLFLYSSPKLEINDQTKMSNFLKDFLINFHGHVLVKSLSSNEKEGHEWVCFLIVCDVKLVVQLSCLSGHVRRQPKGRKVMN